METITETKTAKLKLVKIDETEFWDKKIVKKAGKVFGIYIFDETQTTNLCEITPSNHLRFLYTFTEKSVDDKTDETIRFESQNDDMYVHCGQAEKMKVEKEYEFEYEGESGGEDYENEFERVMDYERGNPTFC